MKQPKICLVVFSCDVLVVNRIGVKLSISSSLYLRVIRGGRIKIYLGTKIVCSPVWNV